jgi:hypothetical protein
MDAKLKSKTHLKHMKQFLSRFVFFWLQCLQNVHPIKVGSVSTTCQLSFISLGCRGECEMTHFFYGMRYLPDADVAFNRNRTGSNNASQSSNFTAWYQAQGGSGNTF